MANNNNNANDMQHDYPENAPIQGDEQERVHEAYSKLGHLGGEKGGEIRKEQMARGEIFTHENPQNPSEPPANEQQRINNNNR